MIGATGASHSTISTPGWDGAPLVHWLESPEAWLVGAFWLLLLVVRALVRERIDLPYTAAPALLTPAERAFFLVLRQAVGGDYQLFAKVRLGDILQVEREVAGKRRYAAFGRISSKHADFVLCNPRTFAVVGVVELDDRSHQRPDRQERDRFFDAAMAKAGLAVLRIPAQRSYDVRALREELRAAFADL